MNILLLGLNHNTASVALRERLALNGCGLELALQEFAATYLASALGASTLAATAGVHFREIAILSTCNRLELYAVVDAGMPASHAGTDNGSPAAETTLISAPNGPVAHAASTNDGLTADQIATALDGLRDFLTGLQNISNAEVSPHLYYKNDEQAIAHLLRVACGLESMILGEPQILGQVSRMQKEAQTAETIGPVLSHLCSQAIRTGRRARTETGISRHSISVSHAAVRLAVQKGAALHHALVVGAGEMAELAATALQLNGVGKITVINRTFSAAQRIADMVQTQTVRSKAVEWTQLAQALIEADVVFSATGAPHTVIHVDEVEPVLAQRNQRPLLFMDLAVPRDIEDAVGTLPNVECCDVDDLQGAIDENMAQRRAAVPMVEAIVAQERTHILDWLSGRQVVPVITELRRKAAVIAATEVAETKLRLRNLERHFAETTDGSAGGLTAEIAGDLVERLAHRIVGKLMHEPTIRLKEQAAAGHSQDVADLVAHLFDLQPLQATHTAEVVDDEALTVEPFLSEIDVQIGEVAGHD